MFHGIGLGLYLVLCVFVSSDQGVVLGRVSLRPRMTACDYLSLNTDLGLFPHIVCVRRDRT